MNKRQQYDINRGVEAEYRVGALYRALGYAYSDGFAKKLESPAPLDTSRCDLEGLARALGFVRDSKSLYGWAKIKGCE